MKSPNYLLLKTNKQKTSSALSIQQEMGMSESPVPAGFFLYSSSLAFYLGVWLACRSHYVSLLSLRTLVLTGLDNINQYLNENQLEDSRTMCWAKYSLNFQDYICYYLPKGLYCSQNTYPKVPSVFHLHILVGVESAALGAPVSSHTTHSSFQGWPHGS